MAEQPSIGRQIIDAVVRFLQKQPDAPVKWQLRESSLEITPTVPGGFGITVYDHGEEALVSANRWHTHFDDVADGAYCVFWLLTPFIRVVHELKAGVLVAVWIERYEPEGWFAMDPVYFLNPEDEPSWRLAGEEKFVRATFTQSVLELGQSYADVVPGVVLDDRGFPEGTQLGRIAVESDEAQGPGLL